MGTGVGIAWLIAGTIATCISAFAAAASAAFSARALQSQTRAVDVSSYLEIIERHQRFERRLRESDSNSDEFLFALREYVNFLEGLAHLYVGRRFGSGTTDLCRDTLCNGIAAIELHSDVMDTVERSFTSEETFKYLVKFRKKHKQEIEMRKVLFRDIRDKSALAD